MSNETFFFIDTHERAEVSSFAVDNNF